MTKTRFKASEKRSERILGADLSEKANVAEAEKEIAEFGFNSLFVLDARFFSLQNLGLEFTHFFFDFFEGPFEIIPLKSRAADFFDHASCALKSRHPFWNAVENAASSH